MQNRALAPHLFGMHNVCMHMLFILMIFTQERSWWNQEIVTTGGQQLCLITGEFCVSRMDTGDWFKRYMITPPTKESSLDRQKSLFLKYIRIKISLKNEGCNMQLGLLSLIKRKKGVDNKFSYRLMEKISDFFLISLVHTSLFRVFSYDILMKT